MSPTARSADPYRDLAVIDARAPRFNQAFVATFSLAVVSALALLAATTGVCLGCQFYRLAHRLRGVGET